MYETHFQIGGKGSRTPYTWFDLLFQLSILRSLRLLTAVEEDKIDDDKEAPEMNKNFENQM